MAGSFRRKISGNRGRQAERIALGYLVERGLVLSATNFRCRHGEIDLVMRDERCLVFVEVRYRNANRFADATVSVDARKQRRIMRTASAYLGRHPHMADLPVRFDVVALDRPEGNNATIRWTKDAFRP